MKQLFFFLLISLPLSTFSQEYPLVFKLKKPINDTLPVIEIDFKNETLSSDFVLHGKTPLYYSAKMNDFSNLVLYKKEENNNKIFDKIKYPQIKHISSDSIISGLKIIDFNKDGNEDLICMVYNRNMTGAIIYLNDPSLGKLIKLWNTAEASDFWVNPKFDQVNNSIKCYYEDTDHGELFESSYILENLTAVAVAKYQKGYMKDKKVENRYIGLNNKWILKK